MSLITVEGIRVYAYHGHLPEEAILGGHFIINVWVDIDALEVEKSDDLNHTVDYVQIIEIVKNNRQLMDMAKQEWEESSGKTACRETFRRFLKVLAEDIKK